MGSRVRQPGWGHWGTREGGALLLSWPPAPTRTPCTWPLQSASGASLKRCRPLLHFQLTPKHAHLCPHHGRQSPPWASGTRMARLRLSRVPKLSVKPPSYQCLGRRGTMFFHNDNQRLPTPTARPWPASSPGELPSPQPCPQECEGREQDLPGGLTPARQACPRPWRPHGLPASLTRPPRGSGDTTLRWLYRDRGTLGRPGRGCGHRGAVTRVFLGLRRSHERKLGVIARLLLLIQHVPLRREQLLDLLGRGVRVLSNHLRAQERVGRTTGTLISASWNLVPEELQRKAASPCRRNPLKSGLVGVSQLYLYKCRK